MKFDWKIIVFVIVSLAALAYFFVGRSKDDTSKDTSKDTSTDTSKGASMSNIRSGQGYNPKFHLQGAAGAYQKLEHARGMGYLEGSSGELNHKIRRVEQDLLHHNRSPRSHEAGQY